MRTARITHELIKISNYFIEQPKTFHTLIVQVQFHVKFVKICDGSKNHTNPGIGMTVEFL